MKKKRTSNGAPPFLRMCNCLEWLDALFPARPASMGRRLTTPVLPVDPCHTPDVTINCAIFRQEDSGHVNCNMLSALYEQATIQYICVCVLPCYRISWSYKAYLTGVITTSRKMLVSEYPKVPCVFVHLEINSTVSAYKCISAVGPFLSSQT